MSVFETEEGALETIPAAAAWVRENIPELGDIRPQVTAGSTAGVEAEVPA
jgi:hypothetical protein